MDKYLKREHLGKPYLEDNEGDVRKKAIQHEKSFSRNRDKPDIIKKRMDSDLFK